MIGKPEWYTLSAFGWGVRAKTWQGLLYGLAKFCLLLIILTPAVPESLQKWLVGGWMGLVLIDNGAIMIRLPRTLDERERLQEMLIARNCAHAAFIAIWAILCYQVITHFPSWRKGDLSFVDVSLLVVLGVMFITKAVSTWVVRRRI
jgi:hypothetical protein